MNGTSGNDLLDATIQPLLKGLLEADGLSATGSAVYFLPKYQRPYAWAKRQREDFWCDLQDAFRRHLAAADGRGHDYLLGTLYLARLAEPEWRREVHADIVSAYQARILARGDADPPPDIYLVVDGQQRIATFFLFCSCIESLRPAIFNAGAARLALGRVDFAYFQALLAGDAPEPLTPSHRRLSATHNYFREQLDRLDAQGTLAAFTAFVRAQLAAVFIELKGHLDVATTLFVSQTDRGKRLTVLERLKSLLVFYSQQADQGRADQIIDDLFLRLYESIERLVGFSLYRRAEDAEADIVRILHVLLRQRKVYRETWRDTGEQLLSWEAGEEAIYEQISLVLRNSQRRGEQHLLLTDLQAAVADIEIFFAYLARAAHWDRERRFISQHDGRVWHPIFQVVGALGLSRFTQAWLVNLYARRQADPSLFLEPSSASAPGFDSVLIRDREQTATVATDGNDISNEMSTGIGTDNDILADPIVKERLRQLEWLGIAKAADTTLPQRREAEVILANPDVATFLTGIWQRTINRFASFAAIARVESISVFNLAETVELSIWGAGKRPISNFMSYPAGLAKHLEHTQHIANDYKHAYLLRDLDYQSAKYLLLCYERMHCNGSGHGNNNDNGNETDFSNLLAIDRETDDQITIHREHIFARDPADIATLRQQWSDFGHLYDQWIWRLGNITLLEHSLNIGEASNLPVWEKANAYCKSRFCHTRQLGKDICDLGQLLITETPDDNRVLRLAAFKIMLDIRELELLGFARARFF